ncbi:MAG: type IV secretion system DNA-binding domain-containing protein, partial [Nitrososphaerota archaeon]|nr:type IV secretion system DNA-binding domain-containing protein [Nitrososphaerota archaeon]
MSIHLGDTSEKKPIGIPVFHTGIFGQSGIGKTKLLHYMIDQVVREDYRVIIIDSKSNNLGGPEFEGVGTDYPFYIEQSTDPDIFRSLIEGMRPKGKGNMERYRGGFIEICDNTKNFVDIGRNLKAKLQDPKIKGNTKAMYKEIEYDYKRLITLIENENFTTMPPKLEDQIIRIPSYRLGNLGLQGLVVKSYVELIMRSESKLIFILDEAPDFVNQKRFNPAKDVIAQPDAKGTSSKIFGWYSGQTLTQFDKANMKNLWYWAIGREMERNEKKDAFETQTFKKYKPDDFAKLKQREFIVITPDFTEQITVPKIEDNVPVVKEYVEPKPLLKEESWDDV